LRLSRTQAAFVLDDHRYCGFVGGVGSGKSYAGAAKALMQAIPTGGLGLVVAPTLGMLRDATMRVAREVWAPVWGEFHASEMRATLTTGAEVLFRSGDDPEKLRGPSVGWAWVDEGSLCLPAVWPVVIGRLRQGGKAGRAWTTFTPKGLVNWTYAVFVTNATAETSLHRATTRSNPFVEEAYAATLAAQYGEQYGRQELGGEFVQMGAGMIQRAWFRVVEAAPGGLAWARYWDLAASEKTTADYTVGARGAFGPDGVLYIENIARGHWSWPTARATILQLLAAEEGEVGVETVAMQLALFQDLLTQPETRGRTIRPVAVDRDKVARAQPWIARAAAGRVALVRGPWVAAFLEEAEAFPAGGHDDQVDAVSGLVQLLATGGPPAADVGLDPEPTAALSRPPLFQRGGVGLGLGLRRR
jgi:predicted phage terminase large subunit-like protein